MIEEKLGVTPQPRDLVDVRQGGGVALSERPGLKTSDCHLNGSRKKPIVQCRPDDRGNERSKEIPTKRR